MIKLVGLLFLLNFISPLVTASNIPTCLNCRNKEMLLAPPIITGHSLTPVNAIFYNFTATTNELTSIYAIYYPIAGEYCQNITLRSMYTNNGLNHAISFSRLYANTTYQFFIYQRGTQAPVLYSSTFTTMALPLILQ